MSSLPQTRAGARMPTTRKERRKARKAFKRDLDLAQKAEDDASAELRQQERATSARNKTISKQIKERDRELSGASQKQRRRRAAATDVYDAIGFERIFRNGICEVEGGLYSETLAFSDVSYQSAREDAQRSTFDILGNLLNYFGADTTIEYTLVNRPVLEEKIGNRTFFDVESEPTELKGFAEQYNKVLNDKMREGCSNIKRERYLTYSVPAPDPERAATTLARMRGSIRQFFSSVRSGTEVLDGTARLELIHSLLRPGQPFVFDFEKDLSLKSPLTTKDFVCPTSLDFRPDGKAAAYFRSEDMWCQVLVMRENFGSELDDRSISNLLDLAIPMAISWHLRPIDRAQAIALVKRQAAWIQKEIIDNQRTALRQGYDYSILPPELSETKSENEKALDYILHKNQRLFYFTGLVLTYAPTLAKLREQSQEIVRCAHGGGIELATLDLQQKQGLNSVLPLGHNHVGVSRDFYTSEAAILVPFTTLEMDMEGGGYYGQNRLSNNLIICDRKKLVSPHGFICGMSGSGKSFAVKREIENTILSEPKAEVYINDVTGEYEYLVLKNGGNQLKLGPDANVWCNPFDMGDVTAADMSWNAALAGKQDAILAMTSALMAEGGEALPQTRRSVINSAVERAYHEAIAERGAGASPTLSDFCRTLSQTPEDMGRADALELRVIFDRFTSGPMSFLNHQSNIDYDAKRITSFNTKEVPTDMRVFTMLANLESQRSRMFRNHAHGITTYIYIDEVQSLFGHPAIITYLGRLWRESRKFGCVMTGMAQSSAAMAAHEESSAIMGQSGFLLLFRQADEDRRYWVANRNLSLSEEGCIDDTARPGQGLLIADSARVPITDDFPKGNDLYDMFNTSPEEYAKKLSFMEESR